MSGSRRSRDPLFNDYCKLFPELKKAFLIKPIKSVRPWSYVGKGYGLSTKQVRDHLEGKKYIATSASSIVRFGIIDVDHGGIAEVNLIKTNLKMKKSNSMVCTSESENHFHILFKPKIFGRLPTIDEIQDRIGSYCRELYPAQNRNIRLPFGAGQRLVNDPTLGWRELTVMFSELEDYHIDDIVPNIKNNYLNLKTDIGSNASAYTGRKMKHDEILMKAVKIRQNGLIEHSSRNNSQFYLLYACRHCNMDMENSIDRTFDIVTQKSNGFSKEVNDGKFEIILDEIRRQAKIVWEKYHPSQPKVGMAFISKHDLKYIIMTTKCNQAQSRFMYKLGVLAMKRNKLNKFFPLNHKMMIGASNSRDYTIRISEMKKLGVIKRMEDFEIGVMSKMIRVKWPTDFPANRQKKKAPSDFEEAIRAHLSPEELLEVLKEAGLPPSRRKKIKERIFQKEKA